MQKVKEYLEIGFKKPLRVNGKTIKFNVDSLDLTGIYLLNGFNMSRFEDEVKSVEIKRSGTKLTIIVETK